MWASDFMRPWPGSVENGVTLVNYPWQVLIVIGLTAGGTTAFYTYTTYMQKFLKLSERDNND